MACRCCGLVVCCCPNRRLPRRLWLTVSGAVGTCACFNGSYPLDWSEEHQRWQGGPFGTCEKPGYGFVRCDKFRAPDDQRCYFEVFLRCPSGSEDCLVPPNCPFGVGGTVELEDTDCGPPLLFSFGPLDGLAIQSCCNQTDWAGAMLTVTEE